MLKNLNKDPSKKLIPKYDRVKKIDKNKKIDITETLKVMANRNKTKVKARKRPLEEKHTSVKIGDPFTGQVIEVVQVKKDCTSCALFSFCSNKKRASGFYCDKFKPFATSYKAAKNFLSKNHDKKEKEIELFKFDPDKEDTSDIEALIDNAIKESEFYRPHQDMKIDDRDFPVAKNFMEFATDLRYLDEKPFPRQVQIGLEYFNEICPNCSNAKWWRKFPVDASYEEILENLVLLEHGKCPKCKKTRVEFLQEGVFLPYNTLVAVAGQRSGKSVVSAQLSAYTLHRYMKRGNPAREMELSKRSSKLHGCFVALTFQQARETIWDPFYGLITQSPWFEEYRKMMNHFSNKYSEELYKIGEIMMDFKYHGLQIYPAGPDKRKLRGRTRFIAMIDELAWFFDQKSQGQNSANIKINDKEVLQAVRASMKTVTSRCRRFIEQGIDFPQPIMGTVSSPVDYNDMIMKTYRRSLKADNTDIYGIKASTWEFNPNYRRSDFKVEYDDDPVVADRDFGANPPNDEGNYLDDIGVARSLCVGLPNAAKITPYIMRTNTGKEMTSAIYTPVWKDRSIPKLMTIDAGYSNNSFAISIAHNQRNIAVFDLLSEVIPSQLHKMNYPDLFKKVIYPLIRDFNVKMVVADRWESIKMLQDIEQKFKIPTEHYTLKREDMQDFSDRLYDSQCVFPPAELKSKRIHKMAEDNKYPRNFIDNPVSHFLLQAVTVSPDGLAKGDGLTDDIFRTVVLANSILQDRVYKKKFQGRIGIEIEQGNSVRLTERWMAPSPGMQQFYVKPIHNIGMRITPHSTRAN